MSPIHMKNYFLLVGLFCGFALLPSAASADMGYELNKASSIAPIEESSVRMEKEVVHFTIPAPDQDSAFLKAKATFWMHNPTDKKVAFQSVFPFLLSERGAVYAKDVRITIDGKSVPGKDGTYTYAVRDDRGLQAVTSTGYQFPVEIAAGQTAVVVIDFLSPVLPLSDSENAFSYLLASGAGWAGNIGQATFEIEYPYAKGPWVFDYREVGSAYTVTPTYAYDDTTKTVSYVFKDIEPKDREDLEFHFYNPSDVVQILQKQSVIDHDPTDPKGYEDLAQFEKSLLGYRGRPLIIDYWPLSFKAAELRFGTTTTPSTAEGAFYLARLYSDNFVDPCDGIGCYPMTDEKAYDNLISYVRSHEWKEDDRYLIDWLLQCADLWDGFQKAYHGKASYPDEVMLKKMEALRAAPIKGEVTSVSTTSSKSLETKSSSTEQVPSQVMSFWDANALFVRVAIGVVAAVLLGISYFVFRKKV